MQILMDIRTRQNVANTTTVGDRGPEIGVATLFLMVTFVLAIIIRLVIRKIIKGSWQMDDFTIIAAMVYIPSVGLECITAEIADSQYV